ncbi:hypothetical protein Bca4012_064152 [Brassica carinata]
MMMTLVASVSNLSLSRIPPLLQVATCNNEYHLQCITEWSQRSKVCSICWQLFVLKDPARTIPLLNSNPCNKNIWFRC